MVLVDYKQEDNIEWECQDYEEKFWCFLVMEKRISTFVDIR